MPGMSTGLSRNSPVVVSAFYNELLRQGLVVALILVFVGISWSVLRSVAAPPCGFGRGRRAQHGHFHPV